MFNRMTEVANEVPAAAVAPVETVEKKEKKASWTADMWEDYRNANAKEKEYLKEKWGVPW